jgi:phenylalanyl-tRNA synthetase beta chain
LGVELEPGEIRELLLRMRFGAKVEKDSIIVEVPPYRTDILHPMDLVEDVAIAYGYANFTPFEDAIKLRGRLREETKLSNRLRDFMVGMGFQETMTLIMTNKNDLFTRMLCLEEPVAEAESAVSSEHSTARSWLTPSLMRVLEANKNHEYPQRFFEVGACISGDGRDMTLISAVAAHAKTSFSEVKSVVLGLYESLGLAHEAKPFDHPSFIKGRCAQTPHGFYGEVHPQVLLNFGLEVPVTAMEFETAEFSTKK